jgi:RNA polymerase sigma-70 factor (ECF subfamily)
LVPPPERVGPLLVGAGGRPLMVEADCDAGRWRIVARFCRKVPRRRATSFDRTRRRPRSLHQRRRSVRFRAEVLHPAGWGTGIYVEALAHHRFATLVEPHLPSLRDYVERRCPELTDDVMQELGVVAWRRLAEMPPGHERAWLFGVTRLTLVAERRKAAARQAELVDDEVAFNAAPAPTGLSPLLAPPVAEGLARLSDRDRELLLLTAWEGLSTAETAEVLGIRATAVRMGLVRARRRLASALDELDPGWHGTRAAPANPTTASTADPQETTS